MPPPTSPLHGSRCWSIWVHRGDGREKELDSGHWGFWRKEEEKWYYYLVLSFPVQWVQSVWNIDPISPLGICVASGSPGPSQLSWAPRNSDSYPSTLLEYYFPCVKNKEFEVSVPDAPQTLKSLKQVEMEIPSIKNDAISGLERRLPYPYPKFPAPSSATFR